MKIWRLLDFDSENLWIQVSCEKNGGGTPEEQGLTVTVTVTLWLNVPLVPVTLTK